MVTIECGRCGRPVAEVDRDGNATAAKAGSVRDASTEGTVRFRVACSARKHRPEVRTWTQDTLVRLHRAKARFAKGPVAVSTREVRRDIPQPAMPDLKQGARGRR